MGDEAQLCAQVASKDRATSIFGGFCSRYLERTARWRALE